MQFGLIYHVSCQMVGCVLNFSSKLCLKPARFEKQRKKNFYLKATEREEEKKKR